MEHVRYERRGPIALVSLDRPPANALNHETCRSLIAALERVTGDTGVTAAVITGSGRFFSAGLDLFEVFRYPEDEARDFANAFDDVITGWFALPKPVIAAINGHAIAGGAVLAATADFRLIAGGELKTGLTEIKVGVPFPASALEAVRSSCAGPRLPELLLRGGTYGPAEAIGARLADLVVPPEALIERALALAAELGGHRLEAYSASKLALRGEFLARMRAARAGAPNDPTWDLWRDPAVLASMEAFRQGAIGKR